MAARTRSGRATPEDSGRLQRVDRRRGDDPFDPARQFCVQGDERVCLQLSERNVLGIVGLDPPQLLGEVSGPTAEHGVAEEADWHSPDAGEPTKGDIRRDLAPMHCLMHGRERLGAQERRRKKLVLGSDLDPLTCEMEDDAAVDDESGHVAVQATAQPRSISGSTAHDSDELIAA